MRFYFFLFFFIPFLGFSQQTECTTISINNNTADSVVFCVTGTSCYGSSDGIIDITVYGSNQPYSFEWFNNANPFVGVSIQDTLGPDDYIVTITDVNGSLVNNSHVNTVSGVPNFSVFENSVSGPTCFNYSDGIIDLTISGATPFLSAPFYTYLWEDGTNTEDRNSLVTGMYILSMTDANGCNRIDTFNLLNPAKIISSANASDLSCIGSCDGTAIAFADSGFAPYSFQWVDANGNNSGSTQNVANLCYGLSTVYVTDSNGCMDTNEVFIDNPDTLQLSSVTIDSPCYLSCDGEISITISGGNSPYNISWRDSLNNEFNNSDFTVTNLCPSQYYINYIDENGCIEIDTIILESRDSFNLVSSITQVSCFGYCDGEVSVQLLNLENPPLTYLWSNGNVTDIASGLCSDSLSLELIDNRGCRDTFYYFINQPDSISFDSLNIVHNQCFGDSNGSITVINPDGGASPLIYSWNGTSTGTIPGISSLISASYNMRIEDANGCYIEVPNIEITEPNQLLAFYSQIQPTCNGYTDGSITLNITGGISPYFINASSLAASDTTFSNLSSGNFFFVVSDNSSCTPLEDQITLDQPDLLILSSNVTDVLCHGYDEGIIDISVSGGELPYSFFWNGPNSFSSNSEDVNNLSAGNYSLNIVDNNTCSLSANFSVDEPVLPLTPSLAISNPILCFGNSTGEIDLTIIGGTPSYSFAWNNASTNEDLDNVSAGNYTVTINDANGCDTTASITITEPSEITLTDNINSLLCFEDGTGSIDILTQGGIPPYSYLWSTGSLSSNISSLMAGDYLLTVTDNNQCTQNQLFTVTQPDLLLIQDNITNVNCYGNNNGSIEIQLSGGTTPYSYSWNSGQNTSLIDNLQPGIYTVSVTDINGCEVTSTSTITQPEDLVLSLLNIVDAKCYGEATGSIDIDIIGGLGGYSFNWSNGQTSQDLFNVYGGNYFVTVTDANNCSVSSNYFINQPDPFNPSVEIFDIFSMNGCNGDNIGYIDFSISGNTPPYSYVWSNGSTTANISNLSTGIYDIEVLDLNNCSFTDSYTISGPDEIISEFIVTPASCAEKNDGAIYSSVSGGVPPYLYSWIGDNMFASSSSDLTFLSQGTYSLEIVDANGCIAAVEILTVPFEGVSGCLEIPTGFTPNGDGIHDEWIVYGLFNFNNVIVKVYNRWGQEVFSSKGYDVPWDGKYDGVDLPTAAYYYVIEIDDIDKVFNGTVTIKR